MNNCQFCSTETSNAKFCSRSCAGKGSPKKISKEIFKICIGCNNSFDASGDKSVNIYCSRSCAASVNNKKYPKRGDDLAEKRCGVCNEVLSNKRSKFCSNKCDGQNQRNLRLSTWLSTGQLSSAGLRHTDTIRQYIYTDQNQRCDICFCEQVHNGQELRFILDHIDGRSDNNWRDNLRLICPNCDSQQPTSRGQNRGNGRKARREYRKLHGQV